MQVQNTTVESDVKLRSYNEKIIISGDIIEHYIYEYKISVGYERYIDVSRRNNRSIAQSAVCIAKAAHRSKNTLSRLINANVDQYGDPETGELITSKFFTTTFEQPIINPRYANYEFNKFIKRLNYEINGEKKSSLRWTTVPELQRQRSPQAIHFHTVFYNLPFIYVHEDAKQKTRMKSEYERTLHELWQHGHVDIAKVKNSLNVGAYMSKYMGKDLREERLLGAKAHFSSSGLLRPQIIVNPKEIAKYLRTHPAKILVYDSEYENEHVGHVQYKQYSLRIGVG
jgi:hypothetical protein